MVKLTRVNEINSEAAEEGVGIRIRGREVGLRYDLFLSPHWPTYSSRLNSNTCPFIMLVVRWSGIPAVLNSKHAFSCLNKFKPFSFFVFFLNHSNSIIINL